MDDLNVVLTDEPAPDDTPVIWDETGDITDDLPVVGDDASSNDDDPIWVDGETGDGSTGEDDGFIVDEGTGDGELIGDDGSGEDWLIDDETLLGDGEDWSADDVFVWEGDWGCGTIDLDWEILITDDLIRIYDPEDGPKTLDETPSDDTGTETATLDDPAICVIFVCDTII